MANRLVAYLVLGTTLIQVPGSVIRAGGEGQPASELPPSIAGAFRPPPGFEGDLGSYKSPLVFDDGRPVRDAAAWRQRRQEILASWHGIMDDWPRVSLGPRSRSWESSGVGASSSDE